LINEYKVKCLDEVVYGLENETIENEYSANSALDFALELKKSTVSTSTYKGYYNRVKVFKKYFSFKFKYQCKF